jgi:hypothetical protein
LSTQARWYLWFKISMAVNIGITVFWDVTQCSLTDRCQVFGGTFSLQLHGRSFSIFKLGNGYLPTHFSVLLCCFGNVLWLACPKSIEFYCKSEKRSVHSANQRTLRPQVGYTTKKRHSMVQ